MVGEGFERLAGGYLDGLRFAADDRALVGVEGAEEDADAGLAVRGERHLRRTRSNIPDLCVVRLQHAQLRTGVERVSDRLRDALQPVPPAARLVVQLRDIVQLDAVVNHLA